MGSMTDATIAAWQKQAGIEPASGALSALLEEMSQATFEIIKIIELERSGIRDGDGYWHGGDVMGGLLDNLSRAHQRWMDAERGERTELKAEISAIGSAHPFF
jgi:hypothetical protein